jgi:hypothetical protein
MTEPVRTVGEVVGLLRGRAVQLGMTHLEVDARAGLADGHFSKIVCSARVPSLRTIERLCGALDLFYLFGRLLAILHDRALRLTNKSSNLRLPFMKSWSAKPLQSACRAWRRWSGRF